MPVGDQEDEEGSHQEKRKIPQDEKFWMPLEARYLEWFPQNDITLFVRPPDQSEDKMPSSAPITEVTEAPADPSPPPENELPIVRTPAPAPAPRLSLPSPRPPKRNFRIQEAHARPAAPQGKQTSLVPPTVAEKAPAAPRPLSPSSNGLLMVRAPQLSQLLSKSPKPIVEVPAAHAQLALPPEDQTPSSAPIAGDTEAFAAPKPPPANELPIVRTPAPAPRQPLPPLRPPKPIVRVHPAHARPVAPQEKQSSSSATPTGVKKTPAAPRPLSSAPTGLPLFRAPQLSEPLPSLPKPDVKIRAAHPPLAVLQEGQTLSLAPPERVTKAPAAPRPPLSNGLPIARTLPGQSLLKRILQPHAAPAPQEGQPSSTPPHGVAKVPAAPSPPPRSVLPIVQAPQRSLQSPRQAKAMPVFIPAASPLLATRQVTEQRTPQKPKQGVEVVQRPLKHRKVDDSYVDYTARVPTRPRMPIQPKKKQSLPLPPQQPPSLPPQI